MRTMRKVTGNIAILDADVESTCMQSRYVFEAVRAEGLNSSFRSFG